MPLIEVTLIEGAFDAAQKRQIVDDVTDSIVSLQGEHVRPSTVVLVQEIERGRWGDPRGPVSSRAVRAMVRGARAL